MRAALTRSINEIQDDPALRVYGALLCLGHFVTFLYWSQGGVEHMISSDAEAICWPFWEDCWRERFLDTR